MEEEKKDERITEKAVTKYIGETSRSGFERFNEHWKDFMYLRSRSHILKHYVDAHMDIKMEDLKIEMRVIERYRSAFERQIGESVHINANLIEGVKLLDSKNEYNRCTIPRLGIPMDKKDELIEKYEEERETKEFNSKVSKLKSKLRMNKGEKQPADKRRKIERSNCEIENESSPGISFGRREEEEETEIERVGVMAAVESTNLNLMKKQKLIELKEIKKKKLIKKIDEKLRSSTREISLREIDFKIIERKKRAWKEFRDKLEIGDAEEKLFWRKVMELVPSRDETNYVQNTARRTPVDTIDTLDMDRGNIVETDVENIDVRSRDIQQLTQAENTNIQHESLIDTVSVLESDIVKSELPVTLEMKQTNKGAITDLITEYLTGGRQNDITEMNANTTENITVETTDITENAIGIVKYRATDRGKDSVIEVGSDSNKTHASFPEKNYCLHVKSRNESLDIPSKNVFDYVRTISESGTSTGTSAGTSPDSSGILKTSIISENKRLDKLVGFKNVYRNDEKSLEYPLKNPQNPTTIFKTDEKLLSDPNLENEGLWLAPKNSDLEDEAVDKSGRGDNSIVITELKLKQTRPLYDEGQKSDEIMVEKVRQNEFFESDLFKIKLEAKNTERRQSHLQEDFVVNREISSNSIGVPVIQTVSNKVVNLLPHLDRADTRSQEIEPVLSENKIKLDTGGILPHSDQASIGQNARPNPTSLQISGKRIPKSKLSNEYLRKRGKEKAAINDRINDRGSLENSRGSRKKRGRGGQGVRKFGQHFDKNQRKLSDIWDVKKFDETGNDQQ